jgi:hypothetical protein
MPTTTDITDWTGVRAEDVVLYDGGLVLVDRINVLPDGSNPEFLIAHVSGRDVGDDGEPGRQTGMSPNARTLVAVRREESSPAIAEGPIGADFESVDALRRHLAAESVAWQEVADKNYDRAHREKATNKDKDAYVGSLMAASYPYALAALLGVVGREYGEGPARFLGVMTASILTDGDFDNLNADVMAADEVAPSVPPKAVCPSCGQRGGPYCEPNPTNLRRRLHTEPAAPAIVPAE